jgi:fibronectin type 3 domain-containing protein
MIAGKFKNPFSIMTLLAVVLQCSGCKPAAHSITLSWQPPASGSVPVKAYNIYRADKSGGPYALIASDVPVPAYKDANVISHKTYYYVVSTLDAAGAESGQSAEISATVP